MLRILYDGWSLVHAPNSPAALHLLALLAGLPPEIEAQVLLPGAAPDWIPPNVQRQVLPAAATSRTRLIWEQLTLPQAAERLKADGLHLVSASPSLFGRTPIVISPASFSNDPASGLPRGFFDRLRASTSSGGMGRANALFWPEDLPLDETSRVQLAGGTAQVFHLPPLVLPGLLAATGSLPLSEDLDLPETYVLYHGPDHPQALRRLLDAWSWPAGSFGADYPLLLLGLGDTARTRLPALLQEYGLETTARALPALSPGAVVALYRGCTALLHPAPSSPWGGPVRAALACGKPVVAAETPLANALVGPAAYLLPENDTRSMGAALITIVVEESVSERLSEAARRQAAAWELGTFGPRLLDAYRSFGL